MSTRRVCFQLQLKPGLIAEYTARHAAVWPDMLQALKSAGWNNYSLFLRPDGLLIGYVEADDLAASQAAMAALDVNTRWQAEMAQFFAGTTPTDGFPLLSEVFHLNEEMM